MWLWLRQVDSSYVSDSVEVLSALIIIAQTSLFKSLLPLITFVNNEHAHYVEKVLHILLSYFAFSKKKKREETKKKVCYNSSCRRALLDHNMEMW